MGISIHQTVSNTESLFRFDCRILSLALLDELIALDASSPGGGGIGGGSWMWYISREGYLKNIIETLGETIDGIMHASVVVTFGKNWPFFRQ